MTSTDLDITKAFYYIPDSFVYVTSTKKAIQHQTMHYSMRTLLACVVAAAGISTSSAVYNTYKSCNQPVDVIFVFDDKSCISLARDVIVHYKSLMVPETKLKFGVAFCSKTEVEHTGPEAGLSHLLMITENLQHADQANLHPHDTTHLPDRTGTRAENTPYPIYEITDIRSSSDSCLKTVGAMFKEHSSDKSTKLTVLVATKKTWADPKHIQEAAALKGPSYNSTVAVIAAGSRSYGSRDVLEKMASDPSKFMTVSSTNDLHDISNKFAQGACRLTEVDLSTPSFPVSLATMAPLKSVRSCERLSSTVYEVRTHMGPLGYVLETKFCGSGSLFDEHSCTCALKS
ncbi:hypothetical protein RRG08_023156 [Elysia crispata]|uniref:VWFA domain-containing protein n=1 Tax=Elysia crispata TaxID=231223 RepID=A0AAE0XMH8_9GAST|nr:hypothetical protein RRG08_023156 [Elysia crispata]